MTRHPSFGLLIALCGALVLTPDTLFMRWSGMGALEMVAWRGMLMGFVFIAAWFVFRRRDWRSDMRGLFSSGGLTVVLCQFAGAILFSFGIAEAPIPIVLFGVATVPVFSAILAFLLMGEDTHASTWLAMVMVMGGIGIAVLGDAPEAVLGGREALIGAVAGLAVALCVALNFVSLRRNPAVPILLANGGGALLAGAISFGMVGPAAAWHGHLWAVIVTGVLILPVSFFLLSMATRYTATANVSLVMLVETVLGPAWVWLGTGQKPTAAMFVGGAVVVGTLALYIGYSDRRKLREARTAVCSSGA
ncbi:DMT family transporter [Acidihalobacter prosperus]|uniref:Membrane protein n=1 Tax=Acidihalobacter prosperus TaxID=160660 RepID=A0A1A6C8D7_9GAMM|nr:DMT family transporter [Acidihalobacter prosperus]OBS10832.1 membrane protein [Acidihalobacter prosperus]